MKTLLPSLSLVGLLAVGALAADALQIDVTSPVECDRKSKKGDKIHVHYRGTLQSNGEEFDASYKRGTPLSFKLGGGQVIQGWDEGLLNMCIGEKRTLTVGPSKAYGERGMGPIPGGSTLIFETELMGIDGVPKPDKIVPKPASDTEKTAKDAKEGLGEKVANTAGKVAEGVTEGVKAILDDGDDVVQGREEL